MCVSFSSTAQNFIYSEQPGVEDTCDAYVTLGHCFGGTSHSALCHTFKCHNRIAHPHTYEYVHPALK